jgi:uridylate kinase
MDGLIIKISGSLIVNSKNEININFLKDFTETVKSLSEHYDIGIVPGGGPTARQYIKFARETGCTEAQADMVADKVQRLYATLIAMQLGSLAYPAPIDNIDMASNIIRLNHKIGVISGNFPGQSSDNIAAQLAGYLNIKKLVKISTTGGIFTADPNKEPSAKKIDVITYDKLIDMVSNDTRKAGSNNVIDQICAKGIKNNYIELYFISPKDIKNLKAIIEGRLSAGTVVNDTGKLYGTINMPKNVRD